MNSQEFPIPKEKKKFPILAGEGGGRARCLRVFPVKFPVNEDGLSSLGLEKCKRDLTWEITILKYLYFKDIQDIG